MLIVYTGIKGIKYFYTMGNTEGALKKKRIIGWTFL